MRDDNRYIHVTTENAPKTIWKEYPATIRYLLLSFANRDRGRKEKAGAMLDGSMNRMRTSMQHMSPNTKMSPLSQNGEYLSDYTMR
jgi:hypothetical protein